MPKIFTSKTQKIGEIGESIASSFIETKGFDIIERNYTRKTGEIDIVTRENGKYVFIEVKTVSCEIIGKKVHLFGFKPESQFHVKKITKFLSAVKTFSRENNINVFETRVDLICVYLDSKNMKSLVKHYRNALVD